MVATVIAGENQRDGAAIHERVLRGISALTALDIGEGDVLAIMLRNEPAFLESMLIARLAGCYHCPINWHYKADEAGFILRDSGARLLVTEPDLLAQIEGGVPRELPTLAAWTGWRDSHPPWGGKARTPRGNMPYTSGTTGRPKGVRRVPATEAQRAAALETFRQALGLEPGMRAFVSGPLYHSAPNLYALQALMAG